jgi:LCP family protein required for cell wall assembly
VAAVVAGVTLVAVATACTVVAMRSAAPATTPAGPMNILLMGMDDRPELAGGRADTLVVVHIPARHDRVHLVSIPRDTLVEIAGGRGRHRVNQAVELGGYRVAADTVGMLAGVPIDHYAVAHMPAFAELSERIGGVRVCLRSASSDPVAEADFPAGPQVVRGPSALAFVRQRHGLPNGDLDRVVRQQVFLRGVLDRLADPANRRAVLDVAGRALVLDDGWNLADFAGQVADLADVPVETRTIPVGTESGAELIVDPGAVRELFAGLDAPSTPRGGPGVPAPEPPCVA